jgi:hypothetical protein
MALASKDGAHGTSSQVQARLEVHILSLVRICAVAAVGVL